jgi:hypothetical protein
VSPAQPRLPLRRVRNAYDRPAGIMVQSDHIRAA